MWAAADAFFFFALPVCYYYSPSSSFSNDRFFFCFLGKKIKGENCRDQTAVRYNGYIFFFSLSRFISLFDTNLIKSRRSTPFFLCWLDGWDIYLRPPNCLLLFGSVSSFAVITWKDTRRMKKNNKNNWNKNTRWKEMHWQKEDVVSIAMMSSLQTL
jgi:hypothetical protein